MRTKSYFHSVRDLLSTNSSDIMLTLKPLDLDRYLGKWYEIARYTLWFEKGMTNVTAEYLKDETHDYIKVINSGLANGKMKHIEGKAFKVPCSHNRKLRVQFFWPFKGDYWVFDFDEDYQWSVVSDRKKKSLWILSRTPVMDNEILARIFDKLKNSGFDLDKIYMTPQN